MDRKNWLVVILLFLIPIPFISTNCLAAFYANFMDIVDEKAIQDFRRNLSIFRWRQVKSAVLIAVLFIISLAIAHLLGISNFPFIAIFSAAFLTHAAFGQLGWEIQTWNGDSVPETANKWWFRILYSIGIVLLFVAILSGK